MNYVLSILLLTLLSTSSFADTTLSRDGDGLKFQGAAYNTIRSASIGTKGFKCFSTLSKVAWEVRITSEYTSGSSVGAKYFLNGNESYVYPISDKFFQWQNAPTTKSPTITSVCLRAYSSSSMKIASGIFQ